MEYIKPNRTRTYPKTNPTTICGATNNGDKSISCGVISKLKRWTYPNNRENV